MIINDFFTNPKRSARDVAENSQRVDSLVTDALRVMQGPTVSDAVLALKRVLGDREYNGRRGFYSFYVDQILDMYGQQNLAEGADDYLDSDPATGTGDETHELDTGPLTQDPDADYDDMMQPMEATSAVPSPAAAAAAATLDNDGPDIMRNWRNEPKYDRFGKLSGLDDAETTATIKNHMQRWQDKMKNLPDPFAAPTIDQRDDGAELAAASAAAPSNYKSGDGANLRASMTGSSSDAAPAGPEWGSSNSWPTGMTSGEYSKQVGSGAAADSSNSDRSDAARRIAPNGWQYSTNPDYLARQAELAAKPAANSVPAITTKPAANSVPAINAVSAAKSMSPGEKIITPAASSTTASKTTAPLWQTLAQANGIANPDRIYPGQQIKLPNGTFAVVDKGDTLSGIANRYRQGGYNAGTPASQPRKTSVKETDMGDTMDDGFKWGSATMPMQDGSTMQYHAPTNSYKQATPPTRPDLNTNISTISRDSSTNKNGQANQNYSDVSIATNPATGTGDYMHRQDVNGTPTTTFRQNVPAAELAKLRSQHFNEDINRMQNLAGIRKK